MLKYYKKDKGLVLVDTLAEGNCIFVTRPTEEDEDFLLKSLQIPEAFYNDIQDIDERPRIEEEDGWNLIIMRVPFSTGDESLPFNTAPLGLIFNSEYLVAISFEQIEVLDDFVRYMNRKLIQIGDNLDMILRLHLSSSVWFLKYLKQINNKTKIAENNLEQSIRNEDLQTLFQLEKCLVYFMTSLKGNDILFHRLKNLKVLKENSDPDLMEDVEIELRQAQETTWIYSDILTGMMDAYASVISNNLNVVMKRLTSISIILMVPTLISSMYGMNLKNGAEESNYAFLGVVILSLGLSILGVILFRVKKWF